jgi:perosamine synthetase
VSNRVSRRKFLGTVAAGAAALAPRATTASAARTGPAAPAAGNGLGQPALLGGTPVRTQPFPSWPIADSLEEQALVGVVRSGKWGRGVGEEVKHFERAYAALTGARHCLATANGSTALLTSLYALDVGAGDEVIVPPYTFVATVNAVLLRGALPIFVDTDIETFQIDARKIEAALTDRTRAIVPVHLGGSAADLDTILPLAQRRNVPVLEDACQAHLGEWKGRKVGTLGKAGCFSFQASKNLNSGEGGAIVTDDDAFVEACYTFHNNSRTRATSGDNFSYRGTGGNFRLTEFQGAMLQAQMTRLDAQSRTREANAAYLTSLLKEIPGLTPARMYPGCTRNAYHLYMFRYDPAGFAGLPRARFLEALKAEGIPAAGGYAPLDKEAFLKDTLTSRGYRRIYGDRAFADWRDRTQCPQNDRLCAEAIWLGQTMLLGQRSDMEQIAEAARKVHAHAPRLGKA